MSADDTSETSSRATSRKTRVYVFREFLLEKYNLSEGDIILDAAGGAGTLSWLLTNVDDLASVVIDPRKTKTSRIEKSISYLKDHPEVAQERSIPNRITYQPLAALMPKILASNKASFSPPRHLRILLDDDLVEAIRSYRESSLMNNGNENTNRIEGFSDYFKHALERGRNATTLGYREAETISDEEITDASIALSTILKAKLVVGFHPDQATDSCIDLATELGIPFCVVPCCVFPQEFPNRRLSDGTHVRCYSQLLEYLKSKEKSIQSAKLAFNFTETAKNIALYTLPHVTLPTCTTKRVQDDVLDDDTAKRKIRPKLEC